MSVVIVGGGATGLAAAYLLAKAGVKVALVESAPRCGGLLRTFSPAPGTRLEQFYHHFFTHDAEIRWMLAELGLTDQAQFIPTTMGLYSGGALQPFNGLRDVLSIRSMGLLDRARFAGSVGMLAYIGSYANQHGRPALEWFRRWAGPAATAAIWEPLLRVKFGDAAGDVPLAWMAGRVAQRARSRTPGGERLGYLMGSFELLVDKLVERLREMGVEFHLGAPVQGLLATGGVVRGVSVDGKEITADRVVLTLPTPLSAGLVRPLDAAFAQRLDAIAYLGVVCVVLESTEQLSPYYWLNVADAECDFGGVIEQTNLVPPSHYGGKHLVYLSRYLSIEHPLWTMPDAQVLDRQMTQLERVLGRPIRPAVTRQWVFRGRYAAPVTGNRFDRQVPHYQTPIGSLYLASMCHIYPDERSVNNSIRVAAELVRSMGESKVADLVPQGLNRAGKLGLARSS